MDNSAHVVPIKRVDKRFPLPAAVPNAAAFDLPCRQAVTIEPGKIAVVPVNCVVKVPDGCFLLLAVRSSTPLRRGLILANGIGIVDPFYCGDEDEIVVQLLNITSQPVNVAQGECLVQGMFIRAEQFRWHEVEAMGHQRTNGIGYHVQEINHYIISVNN